MNKQDITKVTTQAELDAALANGITDLYIMPAGHSDLRIEYGHVTLWGCSSVVLKGRSSAVLRDNARAIMCDFSQATVSDFASVEMFDESGATLYDISRAYVYDSATVEAYDAAIVFNRGENATVMMFDDSEER